MAILGMPLLTPSLLPHSRNLSSIGASTSTISPLLPPILRTITPLRGSTIIRMGGGPRTFPGGVSKWQWKRMQAKKQKQLLKARLCRERQIYEMRKRAELRAAVSELERPWEVVERAPTLFSVRADEQLKSLADRFHKPGGFDLWSDRDGPQLILGGGDSGDEGIPSARFLPQDAVYSVKPYGVRGDGDLSDDELLKNGRRRRRRTSSKKGLDAQGSGGVDGGNQDGLSYRLRIASRGDEKAGKGYRKELSRRKEFNPQSFGGVDTEAFHSTKNVDVMDRFKHLRISNGGVEREVEHDGKGSVQGRLGKKGIRHNVKLGNSKRVLNDTEKNRVCYLGQRRRSGSSQLKPKVSPRREVHDMSLKPDGTYEFQNDQHNNLMFDGDLEDDFELDLTSWRRNGT